MEEGIFGGVVEGIVDGCNTEKERDQEDQAKNTIEYIAPDHGACYR